MVGVPIRSSSVSFPLTRAGGGWVAALTFFMGLGGAPGAQAQYAHNPFFEAMQLQSQAIGLEMIGQSLRLVDALDAPLDEDFLEQVERMTLSDFARFGGTLAKLDGELAAKLMAALEAVTEAAEAGDDATALVVDAKRLLANAYDVLIDPATQDTAAFKAAVLANLLLAEGGVAEAYEEAVEELWEFPNGWGGLVRVRILWTEIEPLATPQHQADGREMIDEMTVLFPAPQPPDPFVGKNPEEAEAPAQRLVGIIEEVADAALYPGRDLAILAGHLAKVLAPSCQAYADGADEIAAEGIYTVHDHYANHLGFLLDLIAPEVHERTTGYFAGLITVEEDDGEHEDGDPEGAHRDGDNDGNENGVSAAEACLGLIDAFMEAKRVVGG